VLATRLLLPFATRTGGGFLRFALRGLLFRGHTGISLTRTAILLTMQPQQSIARAP
jgi:hypothetical protein